jgi:hypothetical protein
MQNREITSFFKDYLTLTELISRGHYSDTTIEVHGDNHSDFYHVTFEPISDTNQTPLGYAITLYEITEMKKQELDLRNRMKSNKFMALLHMTCVIPFML